MKVSSVATALSFASVFITSVFGVNIEWRVILDCGSSGTRARLYNYDADITPSDRIISEYTPSNKVDRDALSVKPGISTFVGKAGGVNAYLTPLVNQAARWVPPALLSSTTISAYGTAGMRFYSGDEQNDVWEAAIDVFTASPFVFGEAYTLSGDDEGVFGWLSTQYLLQQNKINITGNLGALDLGGASTQIVFQPTQNSIMQDNVRLVLDGVKTQLYSHSYMLSGIDQVELRIASTLAQRADAPAFPSSLVNPCYNIGVLNNKTGTPYSISGLPCSSGDSSANCTRTFTGSGNWTACRKLNEEILELDALCLIKDCAAYGVYQPSPEGVQFYAFAFFWYTVNALIDQCKGTATECQPTLTEIEAAGQDYCSKQWLQIQGQYTARYCLGAGYITTLLKAYDILTDERVVTYASSIVGVGVSWTLGALLFTFSELGGAIEATMSPTSSPSATPTTNPTDIPTSVPTTSKPTAMPSTQKPTSVCLGLDFELKILTDGYPNETAWVLTSECGTNYTLSVPPFTYENPGTVYTVKECLPLGKYKFNITDLESDGLCCDYGLGSYEIVVNDDTVRIGAEFTNEDITTFGACRTEAPTTKAPTTKAPTTTAPTMTKAPTTKTPTTTKAPTTKTPTTKTPTTKTPTTVTPTTKAPSTKAPTSKPTKKPTTSKPTKKLTTSKPTTKPTTSKPTTKPTLSKPTAKPTTHKPTTKPTTSKPTKKPTTSKPTKKPTKTPKNKAPTTKAPTTKTPTTKAPTTKAPTTKAPKMKG